MRRTIESLGLEWLVAGVLLLGPTSCQELNPDFDGPAGSASGSGSDGSTGTGPTTGPMTTTGMGGTGSTSLQPGTSDDTMPLDSSSSGATPTGSSSSGGEEPLYPPCILDADPMCERPYEECYDFEAPEFTVCTLPCQQDEDCPQPATGDAQVECAGPDDDQCLLDCSDGATCPDGMVCQDVGPRERCLWPS